MINKPSKNGQRVKRHLRVRNKVSGTAQRPRLNVFRSEKHIYAQIINDVEGTTLVAASTVDKELKSTLKVGSNKEAAKVVGELVAKRAIEKGITEVVFDRGGYIYHGRVKELAEAAREAGLNF
ncbi:MAG: 50S ribosomal protein L18 [Clostridium sp.]